MNAFQRHRNTTTPVRPPPQASSRLAPFARPHGYSAASPCRDPAADADGSSVPGLCALALSDPAITYHYAPATPMAPEFDEVGPASLPTLGRRHDEVDESKHRIDVRGGSRHCACQLDGHVWLIYGLCARPVPVHAGDAPRGKGEGAAGNQAGAETCGPPENHHGTQ